MPKSLKSFVRENAIRNEVQTWTVSECKDYIKKHEDDKTKSSLMNKKLEIVKELCKNFEKAQVTAGEKRAALLSGIKIKNLVKHAPAETRDPASKSLRNYQKNTGVYLWKKGYNPKSFLGAGASGVVWKCGDEAIKVVCSRTYGPLNIKTAGSEVKDLKELENILKGEDKDAEKNKKYLSTSKHIATSKKEKVGKKAIIKADLAAHGSLDKYVENTAHEKKVKSEGIAHIIKLAKHALKGLKVIHDAGYSHNDIKPDNLLIIEKDIQTFKKAQDGSKKAQAKLEEMKKKLISKGLTEEQAEEELKKPGKKETLQIADFGSMTKITETYNIFGNMNFRAPDAHKLNSEAVEKRDSYSLGATLLSVLINKKYLNYKNLAKQLISKGSTWVYYTFGLHKLYKNDKENVVKFLDLISKMVQPGYSNRISINGALAEVEKLKKQP